MMEERYSVWLDGEIAGRDMRIDMALLMVHAILEAHGGDTEILVEIRREK